jgi:hypothetical protein
MSKALSKEVLEVERLLPEINANHRECHKSGSEALNHAIQAGQLLLKLKECVKHGEFMPLVEKRCDFSYDSAKTYMKISESLPAILKKNGKTIGSDMTIRGGMKLIGESNPKPASKPKRGENGSASPISPKPEEAVVVEAEKIVPTSGDCPKGGDHERGADGTCEKCLDPPPVKQYNDPFDPATFEEGKLDLASKQAPYDLILNSLTQIKKTWNQIVGDERDGVYAIDKRQRVQLLIDDLRGPIAQARPHALCEHCEGKGCKKCHNCGWWPRSVVEGLKK